MREKRIIKKGVKYHVMARITRQEMIFLNEVYQLLLSGYIERAKKKYSFEVHSLTIMGNHFHMIIKPLGESKLSNIMKSILGGFACKFNHMNGYKGHVWHDRFKSKVIETVEYFYRAVTYIADNPVRAGIVDHPLDYRFSSLTALKKKSCGKNYGKIRKMFLSILEKPDEGIQRLLEGYLSEFNRKKSINRVEEHSFVMKKPGRPRKS